MLEDRLGTHPSQTQNITTALLAVYGVSALATSLIVGHFADKIRGRKLLLLASLLGCVLGVALIAWSPSGMIIFSSLNVRVRLSKKREQEALSDGIRSLGTLPWTNHSGYRRVYNMGYVIGNGGGKHQT